MDLSIVGILLLDGITNGAVYALLGPAWCFTINGLSFIAVIVALLLMKLAPQASQPKRSSALSQLKEGLRYTSAHPTIRAIILNLGMISLFGVSILTLLPAWSVDILGGDVKTNGLLLSARGIGSLTGALLIAWLGQRQPRGRMWTIGSLMMPVVLAVFAIARWLPLSMVAMMGLGWAFMVQANISNSLVQTAVPDALRGRVMGIYTLVFFGAMPLGSLLAGGGAHWLGESGIVLFCAVVLALTAALIWLRLPSMRKLT